ncbi:MAG: RNA polymerase sigma factor [Candidatus Aminicenantaceae bacterium]
MRMDEQELVIQIQKGDEMAFAKIVGIYKNKIVNYLYQLTGDYQKAVELSQETFMRVFFKAHKYKPIAPFSSWIYAIASNLAKTEIKRTQRALMLSLDDVNNSYRINAFIENPSSDSGLSRNIRQALNSLHSRYKIPVILKDMEGFSLEEIAEVLDKPVGTIKARVSRGRNYLKKELEKALSKSENSP